MKKQIVKTKITLPTLLQHSSKKWNFKVFMIRIITSLKVFLKEVDFPMSQINVPKALPQKFSKHTYHYCPEAIMKKFVVLTCIVIGLKVLDDGRYFSVQPVVIKEVALFVNIDEQKKRKRKYTSLFIKYLQTAFLKAIEPLQWDSMPRQSEVIRK